MTDLVLILATFAFVAVCVAYIGWCDRIIGPDEFGDVGAGSTAGAAAEHESVPA